MVWLPWSTLYHTFLYLFLYFQISDAFYALRRKENLKDKILAKLEERLHWYENILSGREGPYFGGMVKPKLDLKLNEYHTV